MGRALAAIVAAAVLGGCGDADRARFDAGTVVLAEPGTTVSVGERLFVRYAGLGAELEPMVRTTLGVTVDEVAEGHASEIEGLGEGVVPYYVHAELENHGDTAIDANGPGDRFTIRGTNGREYDSEGVIATGGTFEPCPSADPEANLAQGDAIDDCVVIVLAEGVSPREVRFRGDYAVEQKPVAWKVD